MFGFKKNVIRSIDALLATNEEQRQVNDAHQRSIDALIETNKLLQLRLDRLEGRVVSLPAAREA